MWPTFVRLAGFATSTLLFACCANAQPSSVSFRVYTEPAGARFAVDGIIYTSAATFQWPAGSKHNVRFIQEALPNASVLTTQWVPTFSPLQITSDGASVYSFGGFTDASGLLAGGTDPNQVVTADAAVPWLKISVSVNYRVLLNFFDAPSTDGAAPSCGGSGSSSVSGQFRVGLVYVGSQCYWNNAIIYVPANSLLQLNAFPFPGFVFTGWSSNLGTSNSYLYSYVVKGPVTIAPRFEPAKRVRFETAPLGLQVLVDRSPAPTLSATDPNAPCPHNESLPVTVPSTVMQLCRGDFDFAPGSAHLVGAPTPQYDLYGKLWVFDSWGGGKGQNDMYLADSNTASPDTVRVQFVPGVQASFVTSPPGLKLNVDGRSNWAAYNFVWGSGTTHEVSAPAEQFDAQGRKFTFRNWSNGGTVAQSLTLDANAATSVRMIAIYDGLGRVTVQSFPAGQKLQVDGTDCDTPCTVDRAAGAALRLTAPVSVAVSADTRLDFSGWSDGGAADHVFTFGSDAQVLTASYATSYRLSTSSDPANAVTYGLDPVAPDMFYPSGSRINVSVDPRPGFKFRRWGADLSGTYPAGSLTMSSPHSVIAMADRVPYIAPAGVHNLAGDTPDGTVAPGSLIAITGESLAPVEQTGRVNPLAQTIAGVTVTLGDRLLVLVSVSPQQVVAQVPTNLTDGDYTLQVHSDGQPDVSGTFTVVRNAPGLLSATAGDKLYCSCTHADGSPVTSDSPAQRGEVVTLMGTGFGPYAAPVIDGFFPFNPAPAMADPVQLSVGSVAPVQPDWSGAASGYTGLTATRFQITGEMTGDSAIAVTVTVNGKTSNIVMLPIQ